MAGIGIAAVGVLGALGTFLYAPVSQQLTTMGVWRPLDKMQNIHGHEVKLIPNTVQCEDVHYHAESGLLFAACQGSEPENRYDWFPPLAMFADHTKAKKGGLYVIDPKTFTSTELKITGHFRPTFVTHGIDVISDPTNPQLVHIFAVNHLPNGQHYLRDGSEHLGYPHANSQIELFTHELGSDSAEHQRSFLHDKIRTPNDIFAVSPTSFYFTNDHVYREGPWRMLEDMLTEKTSPSTDIVHVAIDDATSKVGSARGFRATQVLRKLHTNNGLGHAGPAFPGEMVVGDAAGGLLYRVSYSGRSGDKLEILDRIQLDSCVDNPSWFADPYANATHDASGYVVAGLARGIDLALHAHDPEFPLSTIVWHVKPAQGASEPGQSHNEWEKKAIWLDDGKTIRSASAAVIVAIDPAENEGKKQGWLFLTGFVSQHMVATKIDL